MSTPSSMNASPTAAGADGHEPTVLLIRANRNDVDAQALAHVGIRTEIDPYLSISSSGNVDGARRLLGELQSSETTWLVVTSTNALEFFEQLLSPGQLTSVIRSNPQLKFAAIGDQTRYELELRGAVGVRIPQQSHAEALIELLVQSKACRVVIPSGSISMNTLNEGLTAKRTELFEEVVYITEPVAQEPASVQLVTQQRIDAVLFRSPSAVRAFESFNGTPSLKVFCAGKTSARQAEQLGFSVVAISENPSPRTVAQTIAAHLKD